MDREQLTALQGPLKRRYRAEPEAARVTLSASGGLDPAEVTCHVATHLGDVTAGLHPATGGPGDLACSGDMLLEALVACAGVTLRSVATAMRLRVTGQVRAEGDLDFRGTLGLGGAPVGFTAIRLRFELVSVEPEDRLRRLVELTERHCVVLHSLAVRPTLELIVLP